MEEPNWEEQEQALERQSAGTIQRKGFAGEELETTGETAGSILAAQARAMVEARFVMALRRPRDYDDIRRRLLDACERPGFAGDPNSKQQQFGAAWYRKPVGDGAEGFSIRFAEEAMRCMTNMDSQTVTVYDDDSKRILNISIVDLENNTAHSATIIVDKTVERRHQDRNCRFCSEAIRTRTNSRGEPTHIVRANDDDLLSKQNNLASKAVRNCIIRHIPGGILSECRQRILEIRFGDAAKDPGKVRREVSDAFAKLNVLPSGLKLYLGHDLAESTPAELSELRALYKAIGNGEVTWKDALANATGEDQDKPKNGKEAATDLAKKLKAERERKVADNPSSDEKPKDATGQEIPAGSATPAPESTEDEGPSPKTPEAKSGPPSEDFLKKQREGLKEAFDALVTAKGKNIAQDALEGATSNSTRVLKNVADEDLGTAIAVLHSRRSAK